MIKLYPFTENDFSIFKSWIHNEEELMQFAGAIFSYPLTDKQLTAYIKMVDRKPFKIVLKSTNQIIGHCELNFENGNNRLSRILIGQKELRGQKIGEHVVREMVNLLFQNPKITEIDLNVFNWNKAAIKCYEKVGFKTLHNNTSQISTKAGVFTKLNMVLQRSLLTKPTL